MITTATKIHCAKIECKYNSDRNVCTAKSIELSDHDVLTHWEGRQNFQRCKQFELSDEAKEINKALKALGLLREV